MLVLVVALPLPGAAIPDFEPPGHTARNPVIDTQDAPARLHLFFPQDPESTWFLDTYGHSRSSGRRHIGNDLHAPKGSPVYAVAAGMVIRMEISRRAGAYLLIDHGGGWESWYMHLNTDSPGTDDGRGGFATAFAPGLHEGAFVDAGQLIGFVGDSGNAEHTVPHTHFELHRNGRPVDPFVMLVRAHERAILAVQAERLALIAERLI
ncbi:MAG: M23 family metallopeptidase [Acidimicrobiia bacterium]|nr:M23 family metallopeptidase [Acidimicrobiia bacterium]